MKMRFDAGDRKSSWVSEVLPWNRFYDDLRNCGFRALSVRGFRGFYCLSDSNPANVGDCLQSSYCTMNRGDGGPKRTRGGLRELMCLGLL